MLCTRCGFDNPVVVRFCGSCGAGLEQACPRCEFANPLTFSFCGGCGESLATTAGRSRGPVDLIEQHLPTDLKKRGLSQRTEFEGERRQVTVLLCDMADFTSMTYRIGPEAAFALMDQIYGILMDSVYEFEGTVNELTGDGILALFGAPVALEDAPQRAIRSALAIHEGIAGFNEEMQRERRGIPPISMRIGINTGPVVVGALGNDLRVEFKAVGDTVNLAARLEQIAQPATTLVTEETFRLAEGLFRFETMGGHAVKGKAGPVPVFRVISPSISRTRFDISTERGLTPFVGRERELEILLDSYHRAKGGRGQAVSITSEAGLGKSRLLYEFRKATATETGTFLEGRCLSYSRNLTYFPLIDLIRSSFDLNEADSASAIRKKMGPLLREWGVDESSSLPRLTELLTGTRRDTERVDYSPEARKAQLATALTEILVAASESQPLIVALEDLHWIDESSEELLGHLLNSISGSRILMLLTYRPSYLNTWGVRTYHSQITLNRLTNQESLTMARHRLGEAELDEQLEEVVLEKTEGVPFFIEEFLKSLEDLNLLVASNGTYRLVEGFEDAAVPVTIQDVLRSRVDALPETSKQVLKTASVLGREMNHELLRNLIGADEEELLADLSALKDSELLYERGVYPNTTYVFRHALTQEVVHDSLLGRQCRDLHRKAGEVIEFTYRSNLAEHYGVLAEHFTAGEDFNKAAKYSRLAATKARHSGAFPSAIEYTRESIRAVAHLPSSPETLRASIRSRATLAGYLLNLGRPHEAAAAVEPIMEDAMRLDDQSSWPAIFTSVGIHELFATEDLAAAERHLGKLEATPVNTETARWIWFAGYYVAAFLAWNCRFEEAVVQLERCRAISEAAGRLEGVATAENSIAVGFVLRGRLNEARRLIDSALAAARTSHDPIAEALTQIGLGALRSAQGHHGAAKAHLLGGLRSTRETEHSFWRSVDLQYLGDTLVDLCAYREATRHYQDSLAILERSDLVPSWQIIIKLKLARAAALQGLRRPKVDEMVEWREGSRFRLFEGVSARLITQTILADEEPDLAQARQWIDTAMIADRDNELDLETAHDHTCLAEICRRIADREGVRSNLAIARELFSSCGADGFADDLARRIGQGDEDGANPMATG